MRYKVLPFRKAFRHRLLALAHVWRLLHDLCREEAAKAVPGENGEAGSALSYAAVTADSRAPQQLPEQLTEAGPPVPEPAVQNSAEAASAAIALEREDASPAVVVDRAAPEIEVKGCQLLLKKGSSRQNKSGLRQPLVWLDLEMTGDD